MQEEINMNNLAIKFLNSISSWIDKRITDRTKECLRTKIAIIIREYKKEKEDTNKEKTYDVILSGDYGRYLSLKEDLDNGDIDKTQFDKEVDMLTLDNLTTIKTDTYDVGDYVLIGYVDNKLTNSFILYKNVKKGV